MNNRAGMPTSLAEEFDKLGLVPLVYYLRDERSRPRATVCLLIEPQYGEVLAKGKALCSLKDNCVKAKGRAIAGGRALRAARDEISHVAKLPPTDVDPFLHFQDPYVQEYRPPLTTFDGDLVSRWLEKFHEHSEPTA